MKLEMMKLCSIFFLLTGAAAAPSIIYSFTSTCAVQGSTVTLPCSFTPLTFTHDKGGRRVQLQLVRVVWCKNYPFCERPTPSVYDSNVTQNPGFKYLGDMKSNCTLQISEVQKQHTGTFRFRMESTSLKGTITNTTGVRLTVIESDQMMIINSSQTEAVLIRGHTLELHCTSLCTFHQLKVTWRRNGHALSESGPSLQLSTRDPENSGNYTCALGTNKNTESLPFSLMVEGGQNKNLFLILGVVCGLILITLPLTIFIIVKRKRASAAGASKGERGETEPKISEVETGGDGMDVQYASVKFKDKRQNRRVEEEDVIYSSVVGV